jgi:hypothetical protein
MIQSAQCSPVSSVDNEYSVASSDTSSIFHPKSLFSSSPMETPLISSSAIISSSIKQPCVNNTRKEHIVYFERFYALFMFAMINIANSMMWITFAPISDETSEFFDDIGYSPPFFI